MPWVLFWIFPVSSIALWIVDRLETRHADQDVAPVNLTRLDNLLGQLLPEDRPLVEDAEVAWLEDLMAMPSAPGSLPPMRPFDPDPHKLPSRRARHSTNRLHRGF